MGNDKRARLVSNVEMVSIGSKAKARAYLAIWRKKYSLSGEQLAGRMGTTKGTISKWEAKVAIDPEIAGRYAHALDPELTWRDMYRRPEEGRSLDALVSSEPPDVQKNFSDMIAGLVRRRA